MMNNYDYEIFKSREKHLLRLCSPTGWEAAITPFDAANFVRFARLPLAPSGGEHVSRETKNQRASFIVLVRVWQG